jgi:hypothetical protein
MRLRCTLGTALLLTMLAACGQSLATGAESGRLAALAARQDLRDMICLARADGPISQADRVSILKEAKGVLPPDEFASFKRALDRIAPPKKMPAKRVAKTTRKKPASVRPEAALVIPTSALLPDRMAPPVFLR